MRQHKTPDEPSTEATEPSPPLTFDLITEPWIPIIWRDGTEAEVGLKEALTSAHEIRVIHDPMPPVEFGVYRLLTALVGDIFAPEGRLWDTEDLADLLDGGRFDPDRIDDYFDDFRDRFDLFHPIRPFLQTAFEGEEKPLAGMAFPIPSGTGAAHFHHVHEREFAVSPACAARLLTAIPPFMTAGGAGLAPSINGAPPWYVLVQGANLFETLCFNWCAVSLSRARVEDTPAWRNDRTPGAAERTGAGYLESLTWQPRKVQLIPDVGLGVCSVTGKDCEVRVARMRFTPGDSARFEWRDPNCAYFEGRIQRPREGRDPWRDTGPLAFLTEQGGGTAYERPRLLDQYQILAQEGNLPPDHTGDKDGRRRVRLALYGIRTDLKMKIFEWQRDELAVPVPLLWNSAAQRTGAEEINRAEEVSKLLRSAIKKAFPRDGKGNGAAYDTLTARAQRGFWNALRDDYDHLLMTVAPLNPEDDTERIADSLRSWREQVRIEGWQVLGAAIDDLDTDADAIERLVTARADFAKKLKKILEA